MARQREDTPFFAFCLASFVSNAGGWMQAGAIPFLIYAETGSARTVGIAGLASYLPSMLATVPGGYLADRLQKGRFLACLQAALAAVTSTVWVVAAAGQLSVSLLLLFLCVHSTLLGLGVPGFQTVVAEMAEGRDITRAINLNSAQAQLAKAIGPAFAGLALAHLGSTWAFGVNAVTYVLLAATLFTFRHHTRSGSAHAGGFIRDLVFGFGQTWHHPTRRLAVVLAFLAMFLGGPLSQLLAVVSSDQMHLGPSRYGLLVCAYGCGALVGNFVVARYDVQPSSAVIRGLLLFGAALAGVASANSFFVALVAVAAAGTAYLLVTVKLMATIQLVTPAVLRGRVVAAFSFAYVGAVPLGCIAQGNLTEWIGVRPTLLLAGLAMAALALRLQMVPGAAHALDGAGAAHARQGVRPAALGASSAS